MPARGGRYGRARDEPMVVMPVAEMVFAVVTGLPGLRTSRLLSGSIDKET
jgi:hypothetical protein